MLYREAGQFKTTYAADQQLFPIRQDRIGMAILLAVAFAGVPLAAATPAIAGVIDFNYWFSGVLIPFLIFSLAALGLNILRLRRAALARHRGVHGGGCVCRLQL